MTRIMGVAVLCALTAACVPTTGGFDDSAATFVEVARDQAPELSEGLTDAELLTVGYGICDSIDGDGAASITLFGDLRPRDVAAVNRAARRYLCDRS